MKDSEKIEMFDRFMNTDELFTIGQISKSLEASSVEIYEALRKDGVLISKGREYNLPLQRYIDAGHFKVKVTDYDERPGIKVIRPQTLLTASGVKWLLRKYKFI